jgi:hypothetical protein
MRGVVRSGWGLGAVSVTSAVSVGSVVRSAVCAVRRRLRRRLRRRKGRGGRG